MRNSMVKFSTWLLNLANFIDQKHPDLIYLMPDELIQIPFEVLRLLKRESQTVVGSGLPICTSPVLSQERNQSLE